MNIDDTNEKIINDLSEEFGLPRDPKLWVPCSILLLCKLARSIENQLKNIEIAIAKSAEGTEGLIRSGWWGQKAIRVTPDQLEPVLKIKARSIRKHCELRIPMKSDTDSNNCRTPIPTQIGQ